MNIKIKFLNESTPDVKIRDVILKHCFVNAHIITKQTIVYGKQISSPVDQIIIQSFKKTVGVMDLYELSYYKNNDNNVMEYVGQISEYWVW